MYFTRNFQIMFEVESSGPAGSGILNSDSQILKVVGYQMGEDASGKKCRFFIFIVKSILFLLK